MSEQVEEIYNRIISERLIHHTCQFFEETSNGFMPYGSGVFMLIHNAHFIFTASHVVNNLSNEDFSLYIKISDDEYIRVIGNVKYTDIIESKGGDVAYIKLDKEIVHLLASKYEFLTIDKVRKHNKLLFGAANYCVLGFPENNIEYINGVLNTFNEAYITLPATDKVYQYYKLNKKDWIIVKMTGKSQDVVTKEKTPMNTHFYGLSGCGLWLIIPNTTNNSYEYKLIGIMTDFKKGKYYCLIGNKIHHLIEALKVIERMKIKSVKAKEN